jgi:hypothetical protein
MIDRTSAPTEDDIQTLIDRMVDFDATLTPVQRSVFRSRILAAMPGSDDVEGHNWEMRWEAGPAGIFRQWIWVDDGRGAAPSEDHSK